MGKPSKGNRRSKHDIAILEEMEPEVIIPPHQSPHDLPNYKQVDVAMSEGCALGEFTDTAIGGFQRASTAMREACDTVAEMLGMPRGALYTPFHDDY